MAVEEGRVGELEDGKVHVLGDRLDPRREPLARAVGLDEQPRGVLGDVGVGEDPLAVDDDARAGDLLGVVLPPRLVEVRLADRGEDPHDRVRHRLVIGVGGCEPEQHHRRDRGRPCRHGRGPSGMVCPTGRQAIRGRCGLQRRVLLGWATGPGRARLPPSLVSCARLASCPGSAGASPSRTMAADRSQPFGRAIASASSPYDVTRFGSPSMNRSALLTQLAVGVLPLGQRGDQLGAPVVGLAGGVHEGRLAEQGEGLGEGLVVVVEALLAEAGVLVEV